MDPTPEQWSAIAELCKERNLLPFFDVAYQARACVCGCVYVRVRVVARCVWGWHAGARRLGSGPWGAP